ncbi:39S ribosomal protein L33, mitochondrial [Oleoguttula sp. CCFEE 5521]
MEPTFNARLESPTAYFILTFTTPLHQPAHTTATTSLYALTTPTMSTPSSAVLKYFRITLLRSAIGLPSNNLRILKSLGLHKRLRTVYHPVSPDVAGKIFAVKELVDVSEVDQKLSPEDMRELRRPERGYWVEKKAAEVLGS